MGGFLCRSDASLRLPRGSCETMSEHEPRSTKSAEGSSAAAEYVFVSYHRPDAATAQRVVSGLEAAGYAVWWDEQLPTHRRFREVIDERLRGSQAVVVLWSKLAAKSDWVLAEADIAHGLGKLVQASADSELPPLPYNQFQCARLQEWNGTADHPAWLKVLDGIRAIASGETAARRAPVDAPPRRSSVVLAAALVTVAVLIAGAIYWIGQRTGSAAAPTPTETDRVAVLDFTSAAEPSLETFVQDLADRIVAVM